jgi:hypothetical protein
LGQELSVDGRFGDQGLRRVLAGLRPSRLIASGLTNG